MRTTIAFALCTLLLVVCFTPARAADKKLSSGDIKKLVKEYVEAGSTQPRREEIAEELKQADPAQVGKVLSKYCKDDAERPKALQLAIALKAPGLFKKLEDSFDTLDQQAIIDWCLTLRDQDGLEFLIGKWRTLSVDSKEWKRVDESFRNHRQSAETLDKFQEKVSDVARGEAALHILQWQLGKPDLTQEQAKSEWKDLRAEFVRDYKEFEYSGYDLLSMEGWYGDKAEPVGPNFRVGVMGWWNFEKFPKTAGPGGFVLVVRICHVSGDDGYVGLFQTGDDGTNGFKMEFKPDKIAYCDPAGRVIKGAAYKPGQWQEVKWVVTGKKDKWNCAMYVDGERMLDNGEFSKAPTQLGMYSKNVEFLAGGADLVYPEK